MPFAAQFNFDDENDPNKKNQGGVNVSGQSTSFAANVPGQESSSSAPKQKSSGQYANIQSYLDANKTQADQMGQKITTDVGAKADDATQKIKTFETQAPSVSAYDPNEAIKKANALSDQEKTQYKQMKKTGGYSGPQSLEQAQGYQETAKAGQEAIQSVKNAGTEAGQQQLLKQTYGRPQYSAGENRLDQVLLQNSAGSKSALEGLSQKYAGLDQMFQGAQAKVGDSINKAKAQAQANMGAFIPAEQNAVKGLLDPIQKRAADMNANNAGYISRVTDDVSDNILNDETLAALGLADGQKLFDINLGNYITPDNSTVGLNNAANADERARYAALASLFDDPTMNQISADGKTLQPVTFNKEQFDKDLAAKDAEYQNAYKTSKILRAPGYSQFFSDPYVTPEQLENYWLGQYYTRPDLYNNGSDWNPEFIKAMRDSLEGFKSKYQPNRVVKKG